MEEPFKYYQNVFLAFAAMVSNLVIVVNIAISNFPIVIKG